MSDIEVFLCKIASEFIGVSRYFEILTTQRPTYDHLELGKYSKKELGFEKEF